MKKLKDFIYDKNDIIIVVLILAAAALIITWRMNVILEYPKQLINDGSDTNVTEPAGDTGDTDDSGAGDKAAGDSNSADGNSDSAADDGGQAELWASGAITRDVEVVVTGSTASEAIQCLVDSGLFSDYADYQAACDEQGLDDEKVSAGTFTFEKGSTKAQIARKVNWS